MSIFHPHARPPSLNASQKRTTNERTTTTTTRAVVRSCQKRSSSSSSRPTDAGKERKSSRRVFGVLFLGLLLLLLLLKTLLFKGVVFFSPKIFLFTFFSFPIFVWQKYYSVTPIICNSSPQVGVRPKYRKKTECTLLSLLHIFKLPHLALLFSFSQNNNNKKEEEA